MNKEIIIRGKVSEVRAYTKALTDIYGKDETLENVIIDLKKKKLKEQTKFMEKNFGYEKK